MLAAAHSFLSINQRVDSFPVFFFFSFMLVESIVQEGGEREICLHLCSLAHGKEGDRNGAVFL